MATFAEMGTLAIWYAHLSEDELLNAVGSAAAEASKAKKTAKEAKGAEKRALKVTGKERTRDSLHWPDPELVQLSLWSARHRASRRIVGRPPLRGLTHIG